MSSKNEPNGEVVEILKEETILFRTFRSRSYVTTDRWKRGEDKNEKWEIFLAKYRNNFLAVLQ